MREQGKMSLDFLSSVQRAARGPNRKGLVSRVQKGKAESYMGGQIKKPAAEAETNCSPWESCRK